MNESVTPASEKQTHAHRRARSRWQRAQARGQSAQPSPEAARATRLPFHLKGGEREELQGAGLRKVSYSGREPTRNKEIEKFKLVYYVLWAPTHVSGTIAGRFWELKMNGQDP